MPRACVLGDGVVVERLRIIPPFIYKWFIYCFEKLVEKRERADNHKRIFFKSPVSFQPLTVAVVELYAPTTGLFSCRKASLLSQKNGQQKSWCFEAPKGYTTPIGVPFNSSKHQLVLFLTILTFTCRIITHNYCYVNTILLILHHFSIMTCWIFINVISFTLLGPFLQCHKSASVIIGLKRCKDYSYPMNIRCQFIRIIILDNFIHTECLHTTRKCSFLYLLIFFRSAFSFFFKRSYNYIFFFRSICFNSRNRIV